MVRLTGLGGAVVLQQERHAAEGAVVRWTGRLATSPLELAVDDAVQLGVDGLDATDRRVDELEWRPLALSYQCGQRRRIVLAERVVHQAISAGCARR